MEGLPIMTKTKTRDIGIAFAIIAGIIFLFCTVIKFIATFMPELAYMYDNWFFNSGDNHLMNMNELCGVIETFALATISAICFSLRRSNILICAYLAIGLVNIQNSVSNVCGTVVDIVDGNFDVFGLLVTVFTVLSTAFILPALFFFIIQICTNTRYEKGIVSQVFLVIFALFAVIFSVLAYFPALAADVLGFFVEGKLDMITKGVGGFTEALLVPLINNVVKLAFAAGAFFLTMWLVFRPKTIEIVIETKEEKKARKEAEKKAKAEAKADKTAAKAEAKAENAEKNVENLEPISEE